jgi:mRNA-degrading endonuclease toxin of MazEF toxin-antitoxin module
VAEPRPGEIWLVWTPAQPNDPHQPRPGLVLSEDRRNRAADDFVVVPIFSRRRIGPTRIRIACGSGGLPHDSVLACEKITTLAEDFIEHGPLGPRVSDELIARVLLGVRRALGDMPLE